MGYEVAAKDDLLRKFMEKNKLDGVLLRRRDTFSWITGGKENYIVRSTEEGFVDLLITKEKKYCITNKVEKFRIFDEEIQGLGFEALEYEWWQAGVVCIVNNVLQGGSLGSDTDFIGAINIYEKLQELRASLLPCELDRYKDLALQCTEAVENTCLEIKVGDSEHEVCANLVYKAMKNGIDPMVALVASDERIFKYRHPIPTDKKIEKYAMVVICGRKNGLVANLTRFVHFGELDAELLIKRNKVLKIEAEFIKNTTVGNTVANVLKSGINKYAEVGYKDEWQLLHQGGATGYMNREYIATPDMSKVIQLNQPFTWNPSIAGVKLEDTFIVTESGAEVITQSDVWPMIEVDLGNGVSILRPDILVV